MDTAGAPFKHRVINRRRVSEFIYGIITAMVVIASLVQERQEAWWDAFLIIVAGAAAIWIAHSYAEVVGNRITAKRRLTWLDIGEALSESWPIVTSGFIVAAPLLLAGVGIITVSVSLTLCNILGIAILAVAGYLAGWLSNETFWYRMLLAAESAAIGAAVVAVEYIVHHI